MPLACWIATLNLYPLLVSLISVHPPPSLTNHGFITWGSVHRPLYLRFGLAALRRFFVRFSSNLRPEGLLKGVRSNQGRISDGTWFRNRRRLRTARWALACLPMRSPSSSFWRYKGTEKISYYKTFRPKNAAKFEYYFGQTRPIMAIYHHRADSYLPPGKSPKSLQFCSLQFFLEG